MKSELTKSFLLWIVVGGIGLFFIGRSLINTNAIQPIGEVIEENMKKLDIGNEIVPITIGSSTIYAKISRSEEDRNRGLSGVQALSDDQGMLFVFVTSTKPGFWMKDMNFPIDIVWISKENVVVGLEKNISTSTFPKVFYPASNINYVLEINANLSDKLHISTSSKLNFCVDNCISDTKTY